MGGKMMHKNKPSTGLILQKKRAFPGAGRGQALGRGIEWGFLVGFFILFSAVDLVYVKAIGSAHGACCWRAASLHW